jgi:hypothetical protein
MECLGLHNKSTAEVHPGHMLTGPKEEEDYIVHAALYGMFSMRLGNEYRAHPFQPGRLPAQMHGKHTI